MMDSGIQGQPLEITVVGCSKLKDTEWISRQDPYVCLEYASTKFRTRTCTDGGKNPVFQEKTIVPLIEGLREIVVTVWNSNTLTFNDFIGSGKIQLQKVLSEGYDDSSWPIQSRSSRYAGEVKLIMHFKNAKRSKSEYPQIAPAYMAPAAASYGGPTYAPRPAYPAAAPYPPTRAYPAAAPYPPTWDYPAAAPYPASYRPADPAMYHPTSYPSQTMMQQPYPYPPAAYPPATYPPQPCCHAPAPGAYPGIYPPPY